MVTNCGVGSKILGNKTTLKQKLLCKSCGGKNDWKHERFFWNTEFHAESRKSYKNKYIEGYININIHIKKDRMLKLRSIKWYDINIQLCLLGCVYTVYKVPNVFL